MVSSIPFSRAPLVIARAIGCSLASSKDAASRSNSSLTRELCISSVDGSAPDTATSCIFPVVIVPVLSRMAVSTSRVRSSTSPPLIRIPSSAPRPVPTMIAVGVASPRAHGHAMINTATAAVKASFDVPPNSSHPKRVATEISRTTGTNTPDTRSASL